MKSMNYKKIIPLLVTCSLVVPTVIANAETAPSTKGAKAQYASELKATRDTIKTNREANQSERGTIKSIEQQIKDMIAQLKQNHTLKDKKDAVIQQKEELKAAKTELKDQNANLKSKWDEIKLDRQNKDFAKLSSDLSSIPAMQQNKKTILEKIKAGLDSILSALK